MEDARVLVHVRMLFEVHQSVLAVRATIRPSQRCGPNRRCRQKLPVWQLRIGATTSVVARGRTTATVRCGSVAVNRSGGAMQVAPDPVLRPALHE